MSNYSNCDTYIVKHNDIAWVFNYIDKALDFVRAMCKADGSMELTIRKEYANVDE